MSLINILNKINLEDKKYVIIPTENYGDEPVNVIVRFIDGHIVNTDSRTNVTAIYKDLEEWYEMLKFNYHRGLFSVEKKIKTLEQWAENCKDKISSDGVFVTSCFGKFYGENK